MVKVSVILVNFLGHSDTIECIESLLKSSFRDFNIVVVDNSPDGVSLNEIKMWALSNEFTSKKHSPALMTSPAPKPVSFRHFTEAEWKSNSYPINDQLILIKAEENKGFAAANNVALAKLMLNDDPEFIWLLNNDTVIEPNTLQQLWDCALSSPAGMIGCKLLRYDQPKLIQAVGGQYNKWFGKVKQLCANIPDGEEREPKRLDFVVGASIFIRKNCLKDVGLMNESFFLYFEDLDWALRAKQMKWSLGYCPARVYHKGGASTKDSEKTSSAMADFYYARNRILLALVHYPRTLITLYLSFIVFILNRVWRGQYDRIIMLFKVMISPGCDFLRSQSKVR